MGSSPAASRALGQTRDRNPRSVSFGKRSRQISNARSRVKCWFASSCSPRKSDSLLFRRQPSESRNAFEAIVSANLPRKCSDEFRFQPHL